MLSIRVLGPLEVDRDGELIRIPGTKTQTLLTHLALEVGSPISAERLIDTLWGDDPPTHATNALQARVSELRRALGPDVVTLRAPGYELTVDPQTVDAHQAMLLVNDARSLAAQHPEIASERYASALALWRARDVAGVVDAQSGVSLASHLDELRLTAIEERSRIELAAGRGRVLIGELTEWTTNYPLRESLVELLILALAGAGRQADALAAYRELRGRLVDQLGVEPGPRLRAVEAQVLAQDPTVIDVGRAESLRSDPAMGSIPNPLSSFIDRPDELRSVIDLTTRRRLVTITGPGGAGKTRLAIEAIRTMAVPSDGMWFVSLETISEVNDLHDALGTVLGATGPDPAAAVRDRLRVEALLVVLDNCEHLGDGLGDVVWKLLEDAPGLRILATSQRALGIPGEALFPLGPMSRGPAARLFIDRARDLVPNLRLDESNDALERISEICAQVEDLPLAIELAATRCDVLSLDEISEHLRSGFDVLRDVSGARPSRQQTLESTIWWSYDLLFPDAQLTLQALASFVGGSPIDGLGAVAEALGLPAQEVLDLLSHLVERSIVTVERTPSGSRYHLVDSIHSFARSRAIDSGRAPAIAEAHATWVAQMTSAIIGVFRSEVHLDDLEKLRRERYNIDAALAWMMIHDPGRALDIASGLHFAWVTIGDAPAGASRIERALVAARTTASRQQRALARARAAQLLARGGSVARALELSESALEEIEAEAEAEEGSEEGSEASQAEVTSIRGKVLVHAGRYDEGSALVVSALRGFEALGDSWGVAQARLTIGWAHLLQGDNLGAGNETRAALAILGTASQPGMTHAGHRLLGVLATNAGDYDDALGHYEVALETARAMGSTTDEGQTLARIASAQLLQGDRAGALQSLTEALHISRLAGDNATTTAVSAQIDEMIE